MASVPDDAGAAAGARRDEGHRLLARMRDGDESAFATLYAAYYRPLLRFLVDLLGTAEAAENIVEDVFVALWEQRASLEIRHAVSTYLFAAARNRALNVLRHERVARRWREAEAHALRDDQRAPLIAPDEGLDADRVRAAVRRAVDGLPPQRRAVLMLRWEHGMSYAEIAAVVGSSVVAVERQLSRTLKALRLALPAWLTAEDRPIP